jgi:hypothetical protein
MGQEEFNANIRDEWIATSLLLVYSVDTPSSFEQVDALREVILTGKNSSTVPKM